MTIMSWFLLLIISTLLLVVVVKKAHIIGLNQFDESFAH